MSSQSNKKKTASDKSKKSVEGTQNDLERGIGNVIPERNQPPIGNYYFLGIGINDYNDESLKLPNPVIDVKNVFEVLQSKFGFKSEKEGSYLFFDKDATLEKITPALDELLTRKNDYLIIYFAGHGEERGWIPADGDSSNHYNWIKYSIIREEIKNATKKGSAPLHIAIIADTCYAENITKVRELKKDVSYHLNHNKFTTATRLAFYSSRGKAFDGVAGKGSPFANEIVKYLKDDDNICFDFEIMCKNVADKLSTGEFKKYYTSPSNGELPECGHNKGVFYIITPQSLKEYFTKSVKEQNILKELAWYLAYNYVNISFGSKYMDGHNLQKIIDKDILKTNNENLKHERCRNVAIIGAGMTFDAFNVLPFGDKMVDTIKDWLEQNNETELKNIKAKNKFDAEFNQTNGFEEKLKFLSKAYNVDDVNDALNKIYNIRYRPNLSFEIIAHLLKHGFLDVVINFNFDELLDKAIEAEIGPGTYNKVVSDSDCLPISEITIDGRIKVPLYIKPHGTASNPESLNVNKIILPSVQKLMNNLLNGYMDENNEEDRVEIINLICIGFSMKSTALNSIIREADEKIKFNIFHFNTKGFEIEPDLLKRKFDKHQDLHTETTERIIDVQKVKLYKPLSYTTNPVSIALYELWHEIQEYFNVPYEPRDICRHEIVTSLFYEYGKVRESFEELHKEADRQYFFERTIIELAIIICRNKGLVDPKQITVDKFGKYFTKYKEFTKKEAEGNKDVPFTLYDFLRHIFRMREHLSFSGNLYSPLKPTHNRSFKMNESDSESNPKNEINRFMTEYPILVTAMKEILLEEKNKLIIKKNGKINITDEKIKLLVKISDKHLEREFSKNLPLLVIFRMVDGIRPETFEHRENSRVHKNELGKDYMRGIPVEYKKTELSKKISNNPVLAKYLYRCFKKIYDRQVYDIHPNFTDPQLYIFDSFDRRNVLNTDISLLYEFMKMFKNLNNWDAMLIVSERGKFITEFGIDTLSPKEKQELSKKTIINICCHDLLKIQLKDMRNDDRGLEERYKRVILKINENSYLKNMEVLSLPYFIYEHHMCIFLKKPEIRLTNLNELNRYLEENVSALYYYHRSFVHKINPIIFHLDEQNRNDNIYRQKLASDLKKMIETYYVLAVKARYFKKDRFLLPIAHRPSPFLNNFCEIWDKEIFSFINNLFPEIALKQDIKSILSWEEHRLGNEKPDYSPI